MLAPLLFNIYTHDVSATTARKFAYADDLAILHSASNRQAIEGNIYSGHGNPIFLFPEMEAQAHYNQNNVDSLLLLQQGGMA